MADAPDPLGKRALFWAPAERHEAGPRGPEKHVSPGRQALFSAAGAAASVDTPKRNGRPRPQVSGAPRPVRTSRPARVAPTRGKRPARSPSTKTVVTTVAPPAERPGGPISLSCSKCGTHSDVDVLKYVTLHVPLWFWRPGRGYTSLMKCPACRRRAWISASWKR
jgi:hypothetical protein